MATRTAPAREVTKVTATIDVKPSTKAKDIEDKMGGRKLGSPINGMEEGQEKDVTLTGKIEVREFQGNVGAYFTTKEGISVKVNASFDSSVHKEGSVHTIVCKVLEVTNDDGTKRNVKYAQFVTA
jgi:hypothetical protein